MKCTTGAATKNSSNPEVVKLQTSRDAGAIWMGAEVRVFIIKVWSVKCKGAVGCRRHREGDDIYDETYF